MGSFGSKELEARIDKDVQDYMVARQAPGSHTEKCLPFLLVQVRDIGFVEVLGKDLDGIYDKLDSWLVFNWSVERTEYDLVEAPNMNQELCCSYPGFTLAPFADHNRFWSATYQFGQMTPYGCPTGHQSQQTRSKLIADLMQFMMDECGWLAQGLDLASQQEQQVWFTIPRGETSRSTYLIVEMDIAGSIEVNGPNTDGIYMRLSEWFLRVWHARQLEADPRHCVAKFGTSAFLTRERPWETNFPKRTMELVEFMVKECKWTLVAATPGRQLVFRHNKTPPPSVDNLAVGLCTSGRIQVDALRSAPELQHTLDGFLRNTWRCNERQLTAWDTKQAGHGTPESELGWRRPEERWGKVGVEEGQHQTLCDAEYETPSDFYVEDGLTCNLGKRTVELADFLGEHGWALQQCCRRSWQEPLADDAKNRPEPPVREMQVEFVRAPSRELAVAPLLLIELRTEPTGVKPPAWNSWIQISGRNMRGVYESLDDFITKYMGGKLMPKDSKRCAACYRSDCFRLKPSMLYEGKSRMNGESNLSQWAGRVRDYMVDYLGEWELVTMSSDVLCEYFPVRYVGWVSVAAREVQLVFRLRPEGVDLRMPALQAAPIMAHMNIMKESESVSLSESLPS